MSTGQGDRWILSSKGRLAAAWWNVAICAIILVASVVMGLLQTPAVFLVAGVAAVMEVQFVRQLRKVRGDRGSRIDGDGVFKTADDDLMAERWLQLMYLQALNEDPIEGEPSMAAARMLAGRFDSPNLALLAGAPFGTSRADVADLVLGVGEDLAFPSWRDAEYLDGAAQLLVELIADGEISPYLGAMGIKKLWWEMAPGPEHRFSMLVGLANEWDESLVDRPRVEQLIVEEGARLASP